jgi:hypothetical protein
MKHVVENAEGDGHRPPLQDEEDGTPTALKTVGDGHQR